MDRYNSDWACQVRLQSKAESFPNVEIMEQSLDGRKKRLPRVPVLITLGLHHSDTFCISLHHVHHVCHHVHRQVRLQSKAESFPNVEIMEQSLDGRKKRLPRVPVLITLGLHHSDTFCISLHHVHHVCHHVHHADLCPLNISSIQESSTHNNVHQPHQKFRLSDHVVLEHGPHRRLQHEQSPEERVVQDHQRRLRTVQPSNLKAPDKGIRYRSPSSIQML